LLVGGAGEGLFIESFVDKQGSGCSQPLTWHEPTPEEVGGWAVSLYVWVGHLAWLGASCPFLGMPWHPIQTLFLFLPLPPLPAQVAFGQELVQAMLVEPAQQLRQLSAQGGELPREQLKALLLQVRQLKAWVLRFGSRGGCWVGSMELAGGSLEAQE